MNKQLTNNIMPINLNKNKKILSMAVVQWLGLLPDLDRKDILTICTDVNDSFLIIENLQPKSVTCLSKIVREGIYQSTRYLSSLDQLPSDGYDIIICDDAEIFKFLNSFDSVNDFVSKLKEVLRNDGILMLCFKGNNFDALKYRYWLRKTLRYGQFGGYKFFFCEPSGEGPLSIVPYCIKEASAVSKHIVNDFNNVYKYKHKIKQMLKLLISRWSGIYNPFKGLIVIAGDSPVKLGWNERIVKIVQNTLRGDDSEPKDNCSPFMTFRVSKAKHVALVYDRPSSDVQLIVKVGSAIGERIGNVREEHENLITLSECRTQLSMRNIEVPSALTFVQSQQKEIAVQSPVHGADSEFLIRKLLHFNSRNDVMKMLEDLTKVHINLQNILNQTTSSSLRYIGKEYFCNYMQVCLNWDIDNDHLQSDQIQHGDFALMNIRKDISKNSWGVIDWEWMARGYPPLYDIFSLYTSFKFINKNSVSSKKATSYLQSFLDTYFSKNWFSCYIGELLKSYCGYFALDTSLIFRYFTAYLVFQCNKYRRFYRIDQYQKCYEEMLLYSTKYQSNFIGN